MKKSRNTSASKVAALSLEALALVIGGAREAGSGQATGIVSPRDPASGLPTSSVISPRDPVSG